MWYLAAARLGPRLPAAFADWGRLLARAGRYQPAEYKLVGAALATLAVRGLFDDRAGDGTAALR